MKRSLVFLAAAVAAAAAVIPASASGRAPSTLKVDQAPAAVGPTEVVTGPSSTGGHLYQAVVDRSGVLTTLWSRGDILYASQRSASGSWSSPEVICVAAEQCWSSDLGVNARGRVTVVVGMRDGGSEIALRTKPPGRAWNRRVVLTEGAHRMHGFEPTLSVAANGAAALTWEPMNTAGTVVLRKPSGRRWTHASFSRFDEISFPSGVAARGDGAVLVVANRTTQVEITTAALLRAYRPRRGWLPPRRLGSHGDASLAAFGPHGRAAVVWTEWAHADSGPTALHATEMGARFRWTAAHQLTRQFGDLNEPVSQDLVVGLRGRVDLAWLGRGQRYSTWRPARGTAQVKVETSVPLAGQHATATLAASHNTHGDVALTWFRERPDPNHQASSLQEVHASVRHAGSTVWRPSPTLGTGTCGNGERGDPGCFRPVVAGVLPDGSAVVMWFDLANQLVARIVH